MSIIIFLIVLALLVFVHELGHFIVAKKSGIKVEEFGMGFPPRIYGKKIGETVYSINAIPFGGFVKILGESFDEEKVLSPEDEKRSLIKKPKWIQVCVISAGVLFNIVFAWFLISIGFMTGLPTSTNYGGESVRDAKLTIVSVMPNSPAEKVGIKAGDIIVSMKSKSDSISEIKETEKAQNFIYSHNSEINISLKRGEDNLDLKVLPKEGLVAGKVAIGVSMDMIGTLRLPIHKAIWQSLTTTVYLVKNITVGLFNVLFNMVIGKSDFSQIAGPVGIVGMVGSASKLGFIYLLQFTAVISINLAIVNLIPFPALDGGRLLFIAIEAVKRSPIKPSVANTLNAIGFILLLVLMAVVTVHDVLKLF